MNWDIISKQKGLSEDFIREHAQYLNWETICQQQTLSFSFAREHIKHLHVEVLQRNPYTTLTQTQTDLLYSFLFSQWGICHIKTSKRVNKDSYKIRSTFTFNKEKFPITDTNNSTEFIITKHNNPNKATIFVERYRDLESNFFNYYDMLFLTTTEKKVFETALNHVLMKFNFFKEPKIFDSKTEALSTM